MKVPLCFLGLSCTTWCSYVEYKVVKVILKQEAGRQLETEIIPFEKSFTMPDCWLAPNWGLFWDESFFAVSLSSKHLCGNDTHLCLWHVTWKACQEGPLAHDTILIKMEKCLLKSTDNKGVTVHAGQDLIHGPGVTILIHSTFGIKFKMKKNYDWKDKFFY